MEIEREHHVGKVEAIRRIDTFLDELMRREFPGGVKIKDATKSWVEDVMNFSFKAKKGLLVATISGVIRVSDRAVKIEAELPGVVKTFVGEGKVREVIGGKLGELFAG